MPTPLQLLHGVDTPPSPGVLLRAGPVTALFEPEIGFLRYVRYADQEVLRGIYGAVRDDDWGTVLPEISGLHVDQQAEAFTVRFQAACRKEGIQFRWVGEIRGTGTEVSFSFDGVAENDFLTNRTGLCALHPVPAEGAAACVVEHPDGSEAVGRFPTDVAPHQPFREIRALRQELLPGVIARIEFSGDTFEMEDQRNWTDASFKTYSRPLERPKPYPLACGERVRQAIAVAFSGEGAAAAARTEAVSITLTPRVVGRLPRIGFGVAHHGAPLSLREMERLRRLQPAHLRVDLHFSQADWHATFLRAIQEAEALETRLEVALFVTDDSEAQLTAFRNVLVDLRVPVARWLLFQEGARATPDTALEVARRVFRGSHVFAPLGAGTDNSFADLNRRTAFSASPDFLVFAINPQVHAFDDRTLVENLEGQAQAVRSAARLAAGKPVVVSPVTLRPRFNAEAVGPEPPTPPGELPFAVDPRQMSLFGAGWTVGSLHALARSGTSSATFFETTGWRGVLETESGSPLPDQFPSIPGAVFPLYHPLADLAGARGQILATESSAPLEAEALALRLPNGALRILVANHSATCQEIRVHGVPGTTAGLRTLDLSNVEEAMRDPEVYRAQSRAELSILEGSVTLQLEAFAVATLDVEGSDA